jgi:hypothetical protein
MSWTIKEKAMLYGTLGLAAGIALSLLMFPKSKKK